MSTMNSHNIEGGLLRAKAGKRLTTIQGKMLVEHYELIIRKLDNALKAYADLNYEVEEHREFGTRIVQEYNGLIDMLRRVLSVKVSGEPVQTKDGLDFAWQATDAETGAILTSGHKDAAALYQAVLNIRLSRTEETN